MIIYIPEIKTGIEYDGVAWHSDERAIKVGKEKYDAVYYALSHPLITIDSIALMFLTRR